VHGFVYQNVCMAETVRIDPVAHAMLSELAVAEGVPLTEVLSRAVEHYRRERFFAEMTAGYAALRSDPDAWADELKERAVWDRALADGLPEEPYEST
jgi:hypothetical protein